jgi:DNA helicase IV
MHCPTSRVSSPKKPDPRRGAQYRKLFKVLCDTENTASFTPGKIGEILEWAAVVETAEENAATFCTALSGKPLFSALHGIYTVTLGELKDLLKNSADQKEQKTNPGGPPRAQEDGFQQVRRRKRKSSGEANQTTKKPVPATPAPLKRAPPGSFSPRWGRKWKQNRLG